MELPQKAVSHVAAKCSTHALHTSQGPEGSDIELCHIQVAFTARSRLGLGLVG